MINDSQNEKKVFNHKAASTSDKIALVSELCHIRRHALRAAVSVWREESDGESARYLILAKRAQTLRREYMNKHFGELASADWCLCKSAACLRQLAYEVCEGDSAELKELDDFVDEIWGDALGEDLSDCAACKEDRGIMDVGETAIPIS